MQVQYQYKWDFETLKNYKENFALKKIQRWRENVLNNSTCYDKYLMNYVQMGSISYKGYSQPVNL